MTAADFLDYRLRPLNPSGKPRGDGRYVLYWMQQHRRLAYHHGLQHAVYRARQHRLPLLIFEALRVDYPHAADRHHAFCIHGMLEHRRALAPGPVGYYPYVEDRPGAGKGLLAALSRQAAEVITDEVPCFIVPGHNRALGRIAAEQGLRATAVDSCGLLPIHLLEKPCPTAAVFRRHVHRHMVTALASSPKANPLTGTPLAPFSWECLGPIPQRWPSADAWLDHFSQQPEAALAQLPIDHGVPLVPGRGGRRCGLGELRDFLRHRLKDYGERRSDPAQPVASGLSPYLHWGQLSAYEILRAVWEAEQPWDPGLLPEKGGARLGFWPLSESAQSFLDELITWRELGHHTGALRPEAYDRYDSLPEWALKSLAAHAGDPRPHCYTLEQLEAAQTHDEIWNASMRQLRSEGMIHNYLRMLWGKKILEWSPDPETAYQRAIHLNNKWSLDGRNANSWSGVLWCFGRYDRPWFEREIFGSIRYMSSDSTRRKFRMQSYLQTYGGIQ
ncbi:MAG: deoxyribodipyrimidine photolyase [Planctomycetota bacterium]|nr:MAG: deoxyribodipyrimidine photolyase [Planctomycetota bacterium]